MGKNTADEIRSQPLARFIGKHHPRRATAKVRQHMRLLVVEDNLKLMNALQALEAADQLLFGRRQRRSFHARRAIKDIDEPRALTANAEYSSFSRWCRIAALR